jgi:hypothetical protein
MLQRVIQIKQKSTKKHRKLCKIKDCGKIPNFNYKNEKSGLYCKDHALKDMVNVLRIKCIDCDTTATFNLPNLKTPIYCFEHKKIGMINVTSLKCKCGKHATYNLPDNKPEYCIDCKDDDMINVTQKSCEECYVRPIYNYPDKKSGILCKAHKKDGMMNVKDKKCIVCELILPTYNVKGESTALYCANCKTDDMVNVKNKTCQKCDKVAVFGNPKERDKRYCSEHKDDTMVDLKNKKCEICKVKEPLYGYAGTKKRLRCSKCATDDMVNIRTERRTGDVKLKLCIVENCKNKALFGKLYQARIHCSEHAEKNEYKVMNPKCEIEGCLTKEVFYSDTNYPKRCEEHKLDTDTNIIEKNCILCNLPNYINNNFNMCNDCLDFNVKKVHHQKENAVGDFLFKHGYKPYIKDQIIDKSCSKRRPDFVFDYTYLYVIVEVDENSHRSYACECEQGRMIQIHQDCGGIPVLFIRFNPDDYIDHKNKKNPITLLKRYEMLLDTLNRVWNHVIENEEWKIPLSVCYLYYDGFNIPEFHSLEYMNNKINVLDINIYNQ